MRTLIVILLFTGAAHAQTTITASRVTETTTRQFVTAAQKLAWSAAATEAKIAAAQAVKATEMAAMQTTFIQGPGVTIKKVNDSTYMVSAGHPKLTTKERDTIDVKANRGTVIYNLDKDALEVCNGVRWDQITTGIIVTQPPMMVPAIAPNDLLYDAGGTGVIGNSISKKRDAKLKKALAKAKKKK